MEIEFNKIQLAKITELAERLGMEPGAYIKSLVLDQIAVPRVTIYDVAEAAGVSAQSVSYALKGDYGLSAERRRHILKVAKRLNYTPSVAARTLRLGRGTAKSLT